MKKVCPEIPFYTLVFNICMVVLISNVNAQDTVNILSHNVLAFSGHPKKTHEIDNDILSEAISFYKSKNPDILILQECPTEHYVRLLAESLNFNYVFFKTKSSGSKVYPYGFPGCIMTRYHILESFDLNTERLDIPDSICQRHMGNALVETPLGLIQVTALHLCANWGGRFRENTRLKELEVLFNEMPDYTSSAAHIIAGDFNSLPLSKPHHVMLNEGYFDTHEDMNDPTVPVPNSTRRIDYIFLSRHSKFIYEAEYSRDPYYDPLELYLSDHQPCMTRLINPIPNEPSIPVRMDGISSN